MFDWNYFCQTFSFFQKFATKKVKVENLLNLKVDPRLFCKLFQTLYLSSFIKANYIFVNFKASEQISEESSESRKFSISDGKTFWHLVMDKFSHFKFCQIRINSFRALVLLKPKQDQAFFSWDLAKTNNFHLPCN